MINEPTLISTGEYGSVQDVLQSINAKFWEPTKRAYPNMDLKLLMDSSQYTFDAEINTLIEYSAAEVSVLIDEREYVLGIPGSLFDLVDMLNLLDIGWFSLNNAKNAIIVYGFHEYGDILQNELSVFSAGVPTTGTTRATQTDINREFALKISRVLNYMELDNVWLKGGQELSSAGIIGSTNNQPVAIMVNSVKMLDLKVNGTWHRETKLFSIEWSDTQTSWGSGALTDLDVPNTTANSAFGAHGLAGLVSGSYNTAVGYNSLKRIVAESNNTGVGYNTGGDLESGEYNVFLGRNTGNGLITGNAMTMLGGKSNSTDGMHSSISLGYNSAITASNQMVIGAVPDGDGYGAVTHVITYYTSSKTHTDYYLEASPASGLTAQRGSIAYVNDGSTGTAWLKVGATSTAWEQLQTTSALAITNQYVVFGTGTSVTASEDFKFNVSDGRLTVNGEIYAGLDTGLATDSVIKLSNSISTSFLFVSTATPESVVTAPRSSLTLVNTGSVGRAYLKTSTAGDTGWDEMATLAATQTFTNKRVTKRVGTTTSSATPTINTDNVDMFTITALAEAITSFTTNLSGTPTAGQSLIIRILDDGTARAIAWGASFASRGATLPTKTVLGKYLYVGLVWNEVASVWDCIATSQEA